MNKVISKKEIDDTEIEDTSKSENINESKKQKCSKCYAHKKLEEFGLNEKTNDYFKQCILCRALCRERGKKKREIESKDKKTIKVTKPDIFDPDSPYAKCTRCLQNKNMDDFGENIYTHIPFKLCIRCRTVEKTRKDIQKATTK